MSQNLCGRVWAVALCTAFLYSASPVIAGQVTVEFEAELFGVPMRPGNTLRNGDLVEGVIVYDAATPVNSMTSLPPVVAFYPNAVVSSEIRAPRSRLLAQGVGGRALVANNQGASFGPRDGVDLRGDSSGTTLTQSGSIWEITSISLLFDSRDPLIDPTTNDLATLNSVRLTDVRGALDRFANQRLNIGMTRVSDGNFTSVGGFLTSLVVVPEPSCMALCLLAAFSIALSRRRQPRVLSRELM